MRYNAHITSDGDGGAVDQQQQGKRLAGEAAADLVQDGMMIGLGTGSTIFFTIKRLIHRVREEGLRINFIPTSESTRLLAEKGGIPMISFGTTEYLDMVIDGADEIDPQLNLIKGGGGALLREKLVALTGKSFVVVADHSKQVAQLGRFPLPVEIVPFAYETTLRRLQAAEVAPQLRLTGSTPYVTDNGNWIADCHCERIVDPADLEMRVKRITGVVETGLFVSMATTAIVSDGERVWQIQK